MEKLLVTRKEAADLLSISVDMLDKLRRSKIPYFCIGSRVYFRPIDLQTFVDKEIEKC